MRTLQYSQPRPFLSPLHTETRAFRLLPKPDALKADCVQWSKPGLKTGASVKFSARPGETPAPQQRGSWGGWIKTGVIGLLLATAGKPALAYGCNQKAGDTPLIQLAQSSGSLEQAKSLVDKKKINPIQKDSCGHTAQYYAEQMHNTQLTQYLKNVHNQMIKDLTTSATDNNKYKVGQLLAQGVDINAKDRNGNTALINAVQAGHRGMVNFLLEQGASLGIKDKQGNIALDYAKDSHIKKALEAVQKRLNDDLLRAIKCEGSGITQCHDLERIQTLLDKGANPDVRFEDGTTPLMSGAFMFEKGTTPLIAAALMGKAETIQVLAGAGADLDLATPEGVTALMAASIKGHKEAAVALVDLGANPCLKVGNDLMSYNAYDLAKKYNHVELAEHLEKVNKEEDCYNPSRFMKEAAYTAGELGTLALAGYITKVAITALLAL